MEVESYFTAVCIIVGCFCCAVAEYDGHGSILTCMCDNSFPLAVSTLCITMICEYVHAQYVVSVGIHCTICLCVLSIFWIDYIGQ